MPQLLALCLGLSTVVTSNSITFLIFFIPRYDSGVATTKSKFGRVPSEYILDDVMCDGTETSLLDCGYSATDNCAAGEGAGVICKGNLQRIEYMTLIWYDTLINIFCQ